MKEAGLDIQGQVTKCEVLQSLFNFEGPVKRNFRRIWESTAEIAGIWKREYGGVAQLGEHLLCKQGVIGSIPFISTKGAERGIEDRPKL